MFADQVRRGLDLIRSALQDAPPHLLTGSDAAAMVSLFVDVERTGAAGKALYARRVEETAAYAVEGHPTAASWLASVAGESKGQARGALSVARAMDSAPGLKEAFCTGQLSMGQAREIGDVATVAPEVADGLVAAAKTTSLTALRQEASRCRQRARGAETEAARDARMHASRFLRTWRPTEGGLRGEFQLTDADGARLLGRVRARAHVVFGRGASEGRRDRHEQYLADALVELVAEGRRAAGDGPDTSVVVRVDIGALHRGVTEEGEVCEIAGLGPVSVCTARRLMGDALLQVVLSDAVDVYSVTSTRRTVPAALRTALVERDRACVVPGCDVDYGLEIDHWNVPYALGGATELKNLARVCKAHHDLHTYRGWHLEGGPGHWAWLGPPGPVAAARSSGLPADDRSPPVCSALAGAQGVHRPDPEDRPRSGQ